MAGRRAGNVTRRRACHSLRDATRDDLQPEEIYTDPHVVAPTRAALSGAPDAQRTIPACAVPPEDDRTERVGAVADRPGVPGRRRGHGVQGAAGPTAPPTPAATAARPTPGSPRRARRQQGPASTAARRVVSRIFLMPRNLAARAPSSEGRHRLPRRSGEDAVAAGRVEELELGGVDGDLGRVALGDFSARVHPGHDGRQRANVVGRAVADVGGRPDGAVHVHLGAKFLAQPDRQRGAGRSLPAGARAASCKCSGRMPTTTGSPR